MSTKDTVQEVKRFESAGGAEVYQIPLLEFPGLWGYVYVVLIENAPGGPYRVLIDTGSGFGESNQQLEAGLRAVETAAGQSLGLSNLTHILITHGHIDHFGGLSYVRPRSAALLGVHELDLRNLTNYEERLAVVARRLDEFLIEAGLAEGARAKMIEMYKITKSIYHSVHVDFTYEAIGMRLGPFEMLHVPGHCAGHVVIRLDDLLFSGDHVLSQTSPHQSPEHLTLSTGLEHYLRSLETLRTWATGVRLTLGGHKDPVLDLPGRISAIRQLHDERLHSVLDLLADPHTILEVSQALFGEVHGYNVLLALEEAGAHVEYLYQRGLLGIENLAELEAGADHVPIRYRCLACQPPTR
jgi:glyoxylase-like metal-dependent hydrolase (beta-lactamase superfamily II)